jgi:lysophospholipase L1-like esterase
MPKDLDSKDVISHESVRIVHQDMYIEKMDPDIVMDMICKLAEELNNKFMTDLGLGAMNDGDQDLGSDVTEQVSSFRVIFIGGSHAARLAEAAAARGIEHVNLAMPGFRVCQETVDTAGIMLRETLADSVTRDIIIYQLLDNNAFFEVHEDGSRILPSKDNEDGKYHIHGRLEYADHTAVKNLVNQITPLLRAGGTNEKIILSPLPRYMRRCCKKREHLVNKKEEDYAQKMGEALSNIRDSLKDLVFGKKINNFKVPNAAKLVMGDDVDEAVDNLRRYWSDDPVHMTSDGYDALLASILDIVETATFKRPITKPAHSSGASGGGIKRRQWVNEDDTLAHRQYGNKKFAGRGQSGSRGSNSWPRGGRGGGHHGGASRQDASGNQVRGSGRGGGRGGGGYRGRAGQAGNQYKKWRGPQTWKKY